MGGAEVREKLDSSTAMIRQMRHQLFLLSRRLACIKGRSVALRQRLEMAAGCGVGGDVRVRKIVDELVEAQANDRLEGKGVLLEMLLDMVKNLNRRVNRGKRYSDTTRHFFSVLLLWGGPRVASFVELNMGGPRTETLRKTLRLPPMDFTCINFETMDRVSLWMKDILVSLGIEPGSVGVEVQEDETGCAATGVFVHKTGSIENFCGPAGHQTCELNGHSIPLNRDNFTAPTTKGYEEVCAAFRDNRLSSYARAMVIQLLLEAPGGISFPVLLSPTCNRFDAVFVAQQHQQIIALWPTTFLNRVGPLVTFASDGDSRRRHIAVDALVGHEGGSRYILDAPSITMGPRQTVGADGAVQVTPSHSQDHIHNTKKGFNALMSTARSLTIGKYLVSNNHLYEMLDYFGSIDQSWKHGLLQGMCTLLVLKCVLHRRLASPSTLSRCNA
jgi:hypothetical protein